MENARTVTEIKLSFIRDQIRILSAALEPAPNWRDYGPDVEEEISDKTVEDVLQKLNLTSRQHNRAVFSSQATHHVARQIERLYWNSVDPEVAGAGAKSLVIEKSTDITSSKNISRLPDDWKERDISSEDQERYKELHQRLVQLDAERREHQQRLAQYKHLQILLEPFSNPQANIQPNLVTRDSAMGAELDRMKILAARVANGVSELGQLDESAEKEGPAVEDMDAKLAKVLDMT